MPSPMYRINTFYVSDVRDGGGGDDDDERHYYNLRFDNIPYNNYTIYRRRRRPRTAVPFAWGFRDVGGTAAMVPGVALARASLIVNKPADRGRPPAIHPSHRFSSQPSRFHSQTPNMVEWFSDIRRRPFFSLRFTASSPRRSAVVRA